jgi:hypothetical protein
MKRFKNIFLKFYKKQFIYLSLQLGIRCSDEYGQSTTMTAQDN